MRSWGPLVFTALVLGYGVARQFDVHPLWGLAGGLTLNVLVSLVVWWRLGSRPIAPYRVGGGTAELVIGEDEVRLVPREGNAFVVSLDKLELVSGKTFVELFDREDGRVRELDHVLFEDRERGPEEFVSAVREAFERVGAPQATTGRHRHLGAVTYSLPVSPN